MSIAVTDLSCLLKGIPSGAWVAISERNRTVVAYGADLNSVVEKAHKAGVPDPVVMRVPEQNTAFIL